MLSLPAEHDATVADENCCRSNLVHRMNWSQSWRQVKPLVATAMAEMIWGAAVRHAVDERVFAWGQFALATPVVLWGGWPFFERAWV